MPEEEVTETPPAGAAPAVDIDAELPVDQDSFDRAYVETLRSEAASRRVAAKELGERYENFEKYSEDDRAVWNHLAKLMYDDPTAGAEAMQDIAVALLGETETPKEETPVEVPKTDDGPLTAEKVQEMVAAALAAERTTQAEEHKKGEVVRNFEAQAEKLGYTKGTPQYTTLLHFAANDPSPDGDPVAGAHEKVQAFLQEQVDTFVKARKADADGSATPPSGAGAGLPAAEKPKTLEEASAMFSKMLQDQRQDV